MDFQYDIIVIGGGHAGCEAAHAAAVMGAKTLLITMDMTKLAQMSCNPAMGGIAKGQIVREIDALGGMSGIVTDRSMIQFRMLNKSKGPAMWSPRAQCDRQRFTTEWRGESSLSIPENLALSGRSRQLTVIGRNEGRGRSNLLSEPELCLALLFFKRDFLNGLMHIGFSKIKGGRSGDPGISTGLMSKWEELDFQLKK